MKKPVLVVGGGIAGIQASHDLAEMGVPVFLVESSPTIGGRMAQLDKTFPTNDCSTCILAPKMTACYNHPLVKTLTCSELLEIRGEAPDFTAVVKIKPRYVDEALCKGCNDCFAVCPVKVQSEFDMGVGRRKAIYKPFEQAIPNKAVIDMEACRKCRLCVKACLAGAIDLDQKEVITEIPVSAVVLAAGYDVIKDIPPEFGYDRYKDVITSLEYERILCASGPFGGHVQRPSDGREPKRIAYIQCVGSRDEQCGSGYCSSICCMQAVKGAVITKEHLPSVEDIDIFYMDIRSFGKAFDEYVDSAEHRYGIGFIRSRVSEVLEKGGQLFVKYVDETGTGVSEPYDLVVLSVGLKPNLAVENAGVKTDKYGFVWSHEYRPVITTRAGVYACGAGAVPKDIPETVIEASAAAAAAAKMGGSREVTLYEDYSDYFKQMTLPDLRDVSKEPIRVGVFVCHCGVNIGGYADVKDIVAYAKGLPFVAHAENALYACAIDAQQVIADRIAEHGLNRIVVAACTPRTHETLFQDVMAKAGLNPYLLTMANIRDQCTWVHMEDKDAATHKAKELVRMAVGKVNFAKQLTRKQVGVNKAAMVVGGGPAGMAAALELADLGSQVHLVEASERLGGKALQLERSNLGRQVEPYLSRMIQGVENHSNITVYLNAVIENIDGYVGNFKTRVLRGGAEEELAHGVIVLATGAHERKPNEYLYGESGQVFTQLELEAHVDDGSLRDVKNLVMIQCVGSREAGRNYCSRVCCNQAIKNALLLKEQNPDMNITILYRDIRSYGMGELQYRKAREAGISFVRYEEEQKPVVEAGAEGLQVRVQDIISGEELLLPADRLILSSAIESDMEKNTLMAQMLKVPLNQNGFFLEAHVKLRPVDFATEGIYVCGLAHGPKNMKECMIQGKAAAGRAATVIARDYLETEGAIASADANACAACGDCKQVCPYKAIELIDGHAVVNEVLCKGCGTCSAACRPGAIDINGFSDLQVLAEIEYLLRKAT